MVMKFVLRNVKHGEDAIPPEEPQKDNFIFDGWDTPLLMLQVI